MKRYYTEMESPIGRISLLGTEDGLSRLHIDAGKRSGAFKPEPDWIRDNGLFSETVHQLNEYFAGTRKVFDLPLAPEGTVFQKRVWKRLEEIPFGEVRSYGEIAAALGNYKASRAVGAANGKNPIPIIIPCHRVIGSSGRLTGYAFGLDIKKRLLELEASDQLSF